MPTGYTAIFSDRDVSFREYALRCARAFGACILRHDDDMSEPPKHRVVLACYQNNVDRDTRELDRFLLLTPEQQLAEMEAKADQERYYRIKAHSELSELKVRLEKVLAQVKAWEPPTVEHENYKTFMVEQITKTLARDCDLERDYLDPEKVVVVTPEDHLSELKSRVDRSIKSRDEERARCEGANAWIDALYASLPEA